MTSGASPEDDIISAWVANAGPWIVAVRSRAIESRRAVTDAAVVAAVIKHQPRTVLDVGCGEGWLARSLAPQGCQVTGIDAVAPLIDVARSSGDGDFRVLSFGELARGQLGQTFDAVVCNFSLLGKTSVVEVVTAMPRLLNAPGKLIIQTLHPLETCGDFPYRDGWREGSWAGLGEGFGAPAPWYFRTLGSWVETLTVAGLTLAALEEPCHPQSGRPASVIFTAGLETPPP
ncbi:MAG: class I SAM-dependent methyltransferase [Candidatus Competibacterales bacterium]